MLFTSKYPIFSVTVDVVAFSIVDGSLAVLVIERKGDDPDDPYPGRLALPGGFVHIDEDLQAAARRELQEETGVVPGRAPLEQLRTYGDPGRDPRGRTVSIAFLMVLPKPSEPTAGTDAGKAMWMPVDDLRGRLAFDHDTIVDDAVETLRARLDTSIIAAAFLPEEFTLAELRGVHEVILGRELDPGNFQRQVKKTRDIVEPTGRYQSFGRGRPAETFRSR